MIAAETIKVTLKHKFENELKRIRGFNETTCVTIHHYVWIGIRSIILPGVKIGKYSIIGAGAVVTKKIPSYVVSGGVPAKIIKKRQAIESKKIYNQNEKD